MTGGRSGAALVGAVLFGAMASAALAADECREVRVMVTAGPEQDVLIKYAQSDFEKQTGIQASIETVARDLWAVAGGARVHRRPGDLRPRGAQLERRRSGLGGARESRMDLRKLLPADLSTTSCRSCARRLPTTTSSSRCRSTGIPRCTSTARICSRDAKNQADFKAKYGYDLAPPTTWDQLADIDEFFHRPPDLYGGWMSGVNWGIGLDYQTILFGLGGRAFDLKANKLLANSPESVKAFEIMQRIAKTAPESFATQSFFDADTLMQGGKLASYTNYSYIWAALAKEPDKYGMTVLPGKGIPIGTFFFAVPETAPNVACAVKFIDLDAFGRLPGEAGRRDRQSAGDHLADEQSAVTEPDSRASRQFVAAAEKLTPVEVTWGPEFFEGVVDRRRRCLCRQARRRRKRPTGCRTPSSRTGSRSNRRRDMLRRNFRRSRRCPSHDSGCGNFTEPSAAIMSFLWRADRDRVAAATGRQDLERILDKAT